MSEANTIDSRSAQQLRHYAYAACCVIAAPIQKLRAEGECETEGRALAMFVCTLY